MRLIAPILLLIATAWAALVGLDYGHQFTKTVLLAPGVSFEVLLTDEAKRKDLSGLCIRPRNGDDLERIYGSSAQGLFTRFPQSCVANLKPLLGKLADDPAVSHYLSTHVGVKVIGHEARSNATRFDLGLNNDSYAFPTEELVAMSFREIRSRAMDNLHENPVAHPLVEDVILAIPPFADQLARQAHIDALKLSGFTKIVGLVDEGTAVAVNFASSKKLDASEYGNEKVYYMVYDMGAGSTKATLFSIRSSLKLPIVLEIENFGYDEIFGGEALTNSLYTILVEKLATSLNTDENDELPSRAAARLFEAAEKAKIILSANAEYHVSLESIVEDHDFKTTITREEFEQINMDSMQRITKPIMNALSGTGVSIRDVKSVILAGGSTRVPFVQKHLNVLLGEENISKTVNADESCVMGATARGFQLMSLIATNKDMKVIDKSFHNFEISVNQSDTQSVVFPKGLVIGNTTRVPIGNWSDEFSIELFEDGKLIKSYNFTDVIDRTKHQKCNNDPKYTKQIFANLTLTTDKLFNLDRVELECVKIAEKEGLLKKLLRSNEKHDEEDAEEENVGLDESANNSTDDATNSTSTAKISRKVLRPTTIGLPKPIYPQFQPLTKSQKDRISKQLLDFDINDGLHMELDLVKNELEGSCYELRNLLEDNEDKLIDTIPIDQYRSATSEAIEWLEFDSHNAVLEDFRKKVEEMKELKTEVDKAIKMAETDLSFERMTKLSKESSTIAMKLQSKLLELGNEVMEVRQKYDKEGFEFEKENDRVKRLLQAQGEDNLFKLEKSMVDYQEKLTTLSKMVEDEDEFNQLDKKEIFEKHESVSDSIVSILADLIMVDSVHKKRLELLNDRLNKLIERRTQKEIRERLKQEKSEARKAQAAKATEKAAENQEEEPVESQDPPKNETEQVPREEQEETQQEETQEDDTEEKEAEEGIEHDEL